MRMAALIGVLILLATPASALGQEPRGSGPPAWEIVPCPVAPASDGEVEGRTYDCGVVAVPENHDAPSGRTVELLYMRLRSTGSTPAPDPVVYLAGGPGGSGIHEFSSIAGIHATMGQIRRSRDVIVYDQRGTGYSGLLACGPFQAAIGVVAEDRPDLVPQIEDASAFGGGAGQQALFYAACAAGYRARGLDLAQYNSVASARDIAALTRTLGYTGQYNLYGTSYGTELSLYALRGTPERIRSVVLDGVTSPATPGVAYTAAKLYEQYQSIFRLCAADPRCNGAYPNLEARFIALLREIDVSPIVLDPPLQVNPALASLVGPSIQQIDPAFFIKISDLNNLMPGGGFAPYLPRLIVELEQRKVDLIRMALGQPAGAAATTIPAPPAVRPGATVEPDEEFFAAPIHILLDRAGTAPTDPNSLSQAWVAVAIGDLRARLLAGERQADVIKALIDLTVLPTDGTRPEALTRFADTALSPAAAAHANALVARMQRHDVRLTRWQIQAVAAMMGGSDERELAPGANLAVNCSDELTYSTRETAQRYIDAAPYPGLVRWSADTFEQLYLLSCRFFPPTVLGRSAMDPVTSDTPALMFLEALDIQTPRSYGLFARETLGRSYLVEWETEGHVIAHRSRDGCAGRIAAAFLDAPTREPDASCARAAPYRLVFSLPGDPLPFGPAR